MKLLFLATLCAAAFHTSQGHFFGRAEPSVEENSLTVSLRTSTEIAIPTQVSTITRVTTQPAVTMTQDRHHTVVETQAVPVTRTAWVSNPPVTFTQVRTATETAHKTHTATSILHKTNHIQPTVSVYELGAQAQVPSVPHNAVLKKRVVMDVLVGETNAIFQNATIHSGAISHSLGLICTVGTFVAVMMT